MKVSRIVFAERNRVGVDAVEVDLAVGPGQVLVETSKSMVSQGTELAALTETHARSQEADRPAWLRFPSVPGYLMVGKVVACGSQVKALAVGDRIIAEGKGCWNSHVSHAVCDVSDWLNKVPDGVTDEEAVMSKLASVAMYGVRVLEAEFGETVAVFGLGVVGQLAIRYCSVAAFRRIVAVDPLPKRREVAARVPGVTVVTPEDPAVGPDLWGRSRTEGFDNVIEASGHPAAFKQALKVARILGKIAIPSAPHKPVEIRLYDDVMNKSLKIRGAHGSSQPGSPTPLDRWSEPRQKDLFFQLVAAKRIEVASLISHRVSYREAPAIYKGLLEKPGDYLGVVFDWK